MNNPLIKGLTKQEETLFFGLIKKILAQKLLPEASSNSTEKQLQLELKENENGSIKKEKVFAVEFMVDENGSIDVNSIKLKPRQAKSPTPKISTVFYIISFAVFILGFVVTPGVIIWTLTNSGNTILTLIGYLIVSIAYIIFAVGLFNGKTYYGIIISACIGLFILLLLAT